MIHQRLMSKNFTLLTIANFFMAIAFYFMTPVMSVFMADTFHSDEQQVGIAMFAFTIAAIGIRPFAGYILDGFNRHIVYLISFLVFMLLFTGYALVGCIALLVAIRFLHGLSWGAINTSAYTLAIDFIPEQRRGLGLGVFGISMNIAMALAPLIAFAIARSSGYDTLFYSAVGICLVGFVLASLLSVNKVKRVPQRLSISNLFEKKVLIISINAMLAQIPYGGIISFIALYSRQIGEAHSGLFFILMAIGFGLSRILSGWLYDKFGPRNVIAAGISSIFLGLVIIGFFATPLGFNASAIILGIGFGVLSPTFQAMANKYIAPESRGAANSTYLMCVDSGIGLGMILFGLLIPTVGYNGTFYASAIIELIAILFFLLLTIPRFNKSKQIQ